MGQHAGPSTSAGETVARVVTVRYWAAARAAAGRAEDRVSGGTVAEVLAAVRAVHEGNPRFSRVLAVSALLLDDQPLGSRDLARVPLRAGQVIEVLPPFAGG